MLMKQGRFGPFLACEGYPECKNTKAIPTGVHCPQCGKELVQKRSRRGKVFYGCSGYPDCNFALWNRPVAKECPQCKKPFLVEKYSKQSGNQLACSDKECGYIQEVE